MNETFTASPKDCTEKPMAGRASKPSKLALSPSRVHRKIMSGARKSHAYDGGSIGPWQRRCRRKLRSLLRVPANEGWPLNARTLWTREHPLGTIEKVADAGKHCRHVIGEEGHRFYAQLAWDAMVPMLERL